MLKVIFLIVPICLLLCAAPLCAQQALSPAKNLAKANEKLLTQAKERIDAKDYSQAQTLLDKTPAGFALYYKALVYQNLEEFSKAAQFYAQHLLSNPADANSYYLLGNCYAKLKNHDAAVQAYSKAYSLDSSMPQALFARAQAYAALNNHNNAIADYTTLINSGIQTYRALIERANVYNLTKNNDMAKQDVEKALEIDPQNPSLYLLLAKAMYEEKRYDDVIKLADTVSGLNPSLQEAYIIKGNAYRQKKELALAEEAYNKALETDPKTAAPYLQLANLQASTNRVDIATATLYQALGQGIATPQIYSNLGEISLNYKDFAAAEDYYKKAISLSGDSAQSTYALYTRLIITLLSAGKFNAAKQYAFDRLALNENYMLAQLEANAQNSQQAGDIFHIIGDFYYAKKDAQKAVNFYTRALRTKNAEAIYINRARMYKEQGVLNRAISDYTKAISVNGKNFNTYLERAVLYNKVKQTGNALADLKEVQKLKPDCAQAHQLSATVFWQLKLYIKAQSEAGLCLEIDSNYADGYFINGLIGLSQNNFEEAKDNFDKLAELAPESWQINIARAAYENKTGGGKEKVLEYLQKAFETGFTDYNELRLKNSLGEYFTDIVNTQEYKNLLSGFQK